MRSRAEDPKITLRVIEKIKDKCQSYYRDTNGESLKVIQQLSDDIFIFKKDCLVAAELAEQYIRRNIENVPRDTSRSDAFRATCELEQVIEENKFLRDEISGLRKELEKITEQPIRLEEVYNGNIADEVEEMQQKLEEYQSFMVIEEMKHENQVSDLTNENFRIKQQLEDAQRGLNEAQEKNMGLEKKLKESLNSYSKFLVRKISSNKETQVMRLLEIVQDVSLEVQRSNEFMGQISRMSLTESEIFDVTGIHLCEIFPQGSMCIEPYKTDLSPAFFKSFKKVPAESLDIIQFSASCEPYDKKNKLGIDTFTDFIEIKHSPRPKFLEIVEGSQFSFKAEKIREKLNLEVFEGEEKVNFWVRQKDSESQSAVGNLEIVAGESLGFEIMTKQLKVCKESQLIVISKKNMIGVSGKLVEKMQESWGILSTRGKISVCKYQGLNIFQNELNKSIQSTFSYKSSVSIHKETQSSIKIDPTIPNLSIKCLSILNFSFKNPCNFSNQGSLSITPAPDTEESKSAPSRRRGSAQPRKPAIEEYFQLVIATQTYQAIKMAGVKNGKIPSSDELYQKATASGIQFFSYHDWLKSELSA